MLTPSYTREHEEVYWIGENFSDLASQKFSDKEKAFSSTYDLIHAYNAAHQCIATYGKKPNER